VSIFDLEDLHMPEKQEKRTKNPLSRIHRHNRKKKRRAVIGQRRQRCVEIVGDIQKDMAVTVISAGEWSVHDMLIHALDFTGPAECWIATWGGWESGLRPLVEAKRSGLITSLNILTDERTRLNGDAFAQYAAANCDRFKCGQCHAKVFTLINDKWGVVILSSANLNTSPRLEGHCIDEDLDLAQFHKTWIGQAIKNKGPKALRGTEEGGFGRWNMDQEFLNDE